jgi:hypothetical protein
MNEWKSRSSNERMGDRGQVETQTKRRRRRPYNRAVTPERKMTTRRRRGQRRWRSSSDEEGGRTMTTPAIGPPAVHPHARLTCTANSSGWVTSSTAHDDLETTPSRRVMESHQETETTHGGKRCCLRPSACSPGVFQRRRRQQHHERQDSSRSSGSSTSNNSNNKSDGIASAHMLRMSFPRISGAPSTVHKKNCVRYLRRTWEAHHKPQPPPPPPRSPRHK